MVRGVLADADEHRLTMKLLLAIIQPSKLEAVKEALSQVAVFRLTIVDVQGFGRQKGHSEVYRGHELTVNLLRKVQLQIAVNEDFVEPTVNAIMEAARTGPEGRIGDGKIFILPLDACDPIQTGKPGPEPFSPLFSPLFPPLARGRIYGTTGCVQAISTSPFA